MQSLGLQEFWVEPTESELRVGKEEGHNLFFPNAAGGSDVSQSLRSPSIQVTC